MEIKFKFYGCLITPEYVVSVDGKNFIIDPTIKTHHEASYVAYDILKHEFGIDHPVDIVFEWAGQKM